MISFRLCRCWKGRNEYWTRNTGTSNKEQGTDEQGIEYRNIEQGTRNRRTRNFEVSKNGECGKDYHHSKFFLHFLVHLFLVPCSIFLYPLFLVRYSCISCSIFLYSLFDIQTNCSNNCILFCIGGCVSNKPSRKLFFCSWGLSINS